MAKYQVQTDGGTYEIETEESSILTKPPIIVNSASIPSALQKDDPSKDTFMDWLKGKRGLIKTGLSDAVEGQVHALSNLDKKDEIYKGNTQTLKGIGSALLPVGIGAAIPELAAGGISGLGGLLTRLGIGVGSGVVGGKLASAITQSAGGSKAAQDLAESVGEIGGAGAASEATSALVNKATNSSLSPSLQQLMDLEPTTGQALQHPDVGLPGAGKAASFVENMFAPGTKANAQLNSGKLGDRAVDGLTKSVMDENGPSSISNISSPNAFAKGILDKNLIASDRASRAASGLQAENAKMIAKRNTQQLVSPQVQATYTKLGLPIPPQAGELIEGPIVHKNLLELANKIVDHQSSLLNGPADAEETKLGNVANELLNNASARFDPNGKFVDGSPMSFEEAWDFKQKALDANFNKYDSFKPLSKALNQDIEDSIAKWPNQPKNALRSFLQAKAIVQDRLNLFEPEGTKLQLSKFIDSTDDFSPALKRILESPSDVEKVLNTSSVTVNGQKVFSGNARGDLAGYNLKQLWWDGADYGSDRGISANTKQMLTNFKDPASQAKNKLLYSAQTQDNIEQLLKNISLTQEKSGGFSSWLPKIQAVRAGLAIAPALLGFGTGSTEHGLELAGAEIGASTIARLMANKSVARTIVNLAAGQPLGMSDQAFTRRMVSALQGATITLKNQDGTDQKGSFDRDGHWKVDDPTQN